MSWYIFDYGAKSSDIGSSKIEEKFSVRAGVVESSASSSVSSSGAVPIKGGNKREISL